MGFGLDRPCASEDLAAFKAFYAEHGIPTFRISFFPIAGQGACQGMTTDEAILSTLPHAPEHVGDFVATLKAAGFGTYAHWIKWVRDSSPVVPVGTDLRIERARPEDGKAFDEVVFAAFGGYPHSVPISEQGALLARRIEDALAIGCHTFTAETSPDQPGTTNPSSRNMERAGFRIAYRRPNWVFPDPKPA